MSIRGGGGGGGGGSDNLSVVVVGVYGRTGQYLWIAFEILLAWIAFRIVARVIGLFTACIGDAWSERLLTLAGLCIGIVLVILFIFL